MNRKENKEVSTICFEVRVPMKKTKILIEFLRKFPKKELRSYCPNILTVVTMDSAQWDILGLFCLILQDLLLGLLIR